VDSGVDRDRSGIFRLMIKDKRKEMEKRVDESLEEIRAKGFTWDRANEYRKRQTEWWKECDKLLYG